MNYGNNLYIILQNKNLININNYMIIIKKINIILLQYIIDYKHLYFFLYKYNKINSIIIVYITIIMINLKMIKMIILFLYNYITKKIRPNMRTFSNKSQAGRELLA